MSKYSLNVNGVMKNYRYKLLQEGGGDPPYRHYAFYLDDIYVGQIMKSTYGRGGTTWTACTGATPSKNVCPCFGFATRDHAADFLLKLEGYMHT